MTEYKLTYFNLLGIAEPIRLLFALAGAKYEDNRIPYKMGEGPQIPLEIKQRLPYGQVPLLEFGDTSISQSITIARFLASKFNFHGKNDWEGAKIDEIVDAVQDYGQCFGPLYKNLGEEEKTLVKKSILQTSTPKYLRKFEAILKQNESPFMVGNSVSLADIYIFHLITLMQDWGQMDLTSEYPEVKALVERIGKIPQIYEWIQKRPKTVY